MKQKGKKIKRYKGAFDTRGHRVRRVLTAIVVIALLFVGGYFIARPLLDAGAHLWYFGLGGADSSSQPQPSSSSPEAPQPTATPTPTPTPAPQESGDWAIVTAPQMSTPEQAAATAQALAEKGVTHVVVQLKDSEGTVWYASAVESAARSLSETPIDAAAAAEAIRDAGMTPVAGVCAYRDPLAPYADKSMAVQYAGEEGVLWLDNSPANNGKPWLNPYSETARAYVQAIALETVELGFEQVLFTDMTLPDVRSTSSANFGNTTGLEPGALFTQTVEALQTALAEQNAVCWFAYPAASVSGEDLHLTGAPVSTFGMENLLVLLPDDAEDPAAVLHSCAGAAETVVFGMESGQTPADDLRAAAEEKGYQGAVIGE